MNRITTVNNYTITVALVVFSFCLSFHYLLRADQTAFLQTVGATIRPYKRRITVLEIGTSVPTYTPIISTNYNTICVVMLLDGAQEYVRTLNRSMQSTITLLAPTRLNLEALSILGRCEHFDMVIVHDIHAHIKDATHAAIVDAYLKLGEHLFIEVSKPLVEQEMVKRRMKLVARDGSTALYQSYRKKPGLDIARFSQKDRTRSTKPRYTIESTLEDKLFSKKGLDEPTRYIAGINLVTFVMLNGIYPEDMSIRKQLSAMNRKYDHNDLVLGNIVVQGNKLYPIDFNDKRRDADVQHCITAALKAFKTGNTRQRNPERWMQEYYDSF